MGRGGKILIQLRTAAMVYSRFTVFLWLLMALACSEHQHPGKVPRNEVKPSIPLPPKNQMLIDTAIRYGPEISSTYEKPSVQSS
jgi:hypothetical protein